MYKELFTKVDGQRMPTSLPRDEKPKSLSRHISATSNI